MGRGPSKNPKPPKDDTPPEMFKVYCFQNPANDPNPGDRDPKKTLAQYIIKGWAKKPEEDYETGQRVRIYPTRNIPPGKVGGYVQGVWGISAHDEFEVVRMGQFDRIDAESDKCCEKLQALAKEKEEWMAIEVE